MNNHASLTRPESDEERTVGELLAEIAGQRTALLSRDIIGQAKGIIRLLTRRDDQGAFELLAGLSQDTNRPLREVAEQITESAATGQALEAQLITSWQRRTGSCA